MDGYAWFWLIAVVACVLYVAMMVWFLNGWTTLSTYRQQHKIHTTKVSVIIPFKNEQQFLKKLMDGLLHQELQTNDYEIILVNDNSTDNSVGLIKVYEKQYRRVKLVQNKGHGKKQALKTCIENAIGQLIVITDADCTHNKNWLSTIVDYYEQHNPNMIIGPVLYPQGKGLLKQFQQLEFASLVATGAGAAGINHPIMCNGANLAFKKEVYDSLDDPFNEEYVSGDDVFLMHQFKTIDAEKIHFLKADNARVYTAPNHTVRAFFNQRMRWTSKWGGYKDGDTRFTAVVVFITTLIIPLGVLFTIFNKDYIQPLLFAYAIKTIMDAIYLSQVSDFFHLRKQLKWLPLFQLLYCLYVPITAVAALFSRKK